MSGIAEVLLNLGYKVSGSDQKINDVCKRLQTLGAKIHQGHDKLNLDEGASLLVYSSAVHSENPELVEARRRKIPVIPRAEVLAELMRLKFSISVAGSHGKTTTTSFIGQICEKAGLDPTVIIGGKVKSFGSGGKLGKGEYLVAESDESDRSFLLLRPSIAIITNIDREHLNAYKSFDELIESFRSFANSVPFYGLSVFCIDDPIVKLISSNFGKRQVTYGFAKEADFSAINIQQIKNSTFFDVVNKEEIICSINLKMPGQHFILNSLAAVAVGVELGISPKVIAAALSEFEGVSRRIEILTENNGKTVITDYGHHPTEIRATLRAIREGWGTDCKIRTIFQPHRYTRTRDCFEDFVRSFQSADEVIVLPIYAASEKEIEGITSEILVSKLDHKNAKFFEDSKKALSYLKESSAKNDIFVFQGAGSIGSEAERFAALLY